jgi:hypothetical protein
LVLILARPAYFKKILKPSRLSGCIVRSLQSLKKQFNEKPFEIVDSCDDDWDYGDNNSICSLHSDAIAFTVPAGSPSNN